MKCVSRASVNGDKASRHKASIRWPVSSVCLCGCGASLCQMAAAKTTEIISLGGDLIADNYDF